MSIGYSWNSIWQAMIAYILAAYRTVLLRYRVTLENLWVSIAISRMRINRKVTTECHGKC